MGRLKGHMVYKVISTEFLPLQERALHDSDEDAYLALLHTLLKSGPMYFSYSFDLTNSFQRQAQSDPNLPLWKRADDRFFWNKFIQRDFITNQLTDWCIPTIEGFVETKPAGYINGKMVEITIISRRSRFRAGTR